MPASRNELTRLFIVIGARTGEAERGLAKLDNKVSNFARRMVLAGRTIGVVGIAAGATVGAFAALAKRGTQVTNVTRGFENATRDQVAALGQLRAATAGLLSDFELMVGFNRALTLGAAKNARQFAQLSQTAIALGRALGLDARFAIESLSLGIGRGSRLLLDNLGIVISIEQAYKEYAESIGVATEALTEQQKKTAVLNAATEAAAVKIQELGGFQLTLGDKVIQLEAAFKNLRDAIAKTGDEGGFLGDTFREVIGLVDDLTNGINLLIRLLGGDAPTGLQRDLEKLFAGDVLLSSKSLEETNKLANRFQQILRDLKREKRLAEEELSERGFFGADPSFLEGQPTERTFTFVNAFGKEQTVTFKELDDAIGFVEQTLSTLNGTAVSFVQEAQAATDGADNFAAALVRIGEFNTGDLRRIRDALETTREKLQDLQFQAKSGIPADKLEEFNAGLEETNRLIEVFEGALTRIRRTLDRRFGSFDDFAAIAEAGGDPFSAMIAGGGQLAIPGGLGELRGAAPPPGLDRAIASAQGVLASLQEQVVTLQAADDGTQDYVERWEEVNRQLRNAITNLKNLKAIQDAFARGLPIPELEKLEPKPGEGPGDPTRFPLGKFNSALNIATGALSTFDRELANVVGSLGQVVGQIGLASTTGGAIQGFAIAGAVGAAVGFIGNLLADRESGLEQALRANTQALNRLTADLRGTAEILAKSGFSASELAIISEALQPLRGGITFDALQNLSSVLTRLGRDFDDLAGLSEALGLELAGIIDGLPALAEALALLVDITQRQIDQMRTAFELLDIEDPGKQAGAIFDFLQQRAAQVTDPIFQAFAKDLFSDIDFDTPEGLIEVDERVKDLFRKYQAGLLDPTVLGLTDEQFLSLLGDLDRLGDAAKEAAETLSSIGDQNVPAGFKLLRQFREFQATTPILDPRLISSTTSRPGVPNPDIPTVLPAAGSMVVQNVNVFGVEDIEDFRRELEKISLRENQRFRRSRFGEVEV